MPKLAEAYFHIALAMPESDQADFAAFLKSRAQEIAYGVYSQNIAIDVRIADGTIKAWVRAVTTTFGIFIVGYGPLRQTIDYLVNDGRAFSEQIQNVVLSTGVRPDDIEVFQRRLGVVGKIKRVLRAVTRVESGGLSASERHVEIVRIKALLFDILADLQDEGDRVALLGELPEKFVREAKLGTQGEIAFPRLPSALPTRPEDWDLNAANPMKYVPALEDAPEKVNHEPQVRFDMLSGQVLRERTQSKTTILLIPRP